MTGGPGRTTRDDSLRGSRDPGAARIDASAEPARGDRLGGERSYRLIDELGEGGMGRVFLAERSDGEFRQRVAIKLLSWFVGGDTDAARRFRSERQILARLSHPNIARLLDGGTTAKGQPFLVMEYIAGEPLDDWVERRQPPLEERLRLFLKVCDAVRVAHQSLIVHRDLKPANILVDEAGEPKLLDFGIAKLLDPEAAGEAARTRRGETLLTPRYASPEQVTAGDITTASDIYSLGVILYELLTGRAPYSVTLTAPAELVRAICETQPLPPSSTAREAGAVPARIPRDLDEIVLKSLRKEPAERYGSVEQLSADLRNFLAGRPVEARRGGRTYRLARFARRHRWALGGAAIFAATVVAFVVGLTRQLAETARQRDEAAKQRDTAQAVTDFLVKLFAASDPREARGETVTAREVLDRGAARIEKELAAQPAVRATLLHNLALVYQNLGLLDRSGALFAEALAARERIFPPTAREVVETRYRLGWNHAQSGGHAEGERILRQALSDLDRGGWSDPVLEATISNGLGAVATYQGRYDDAERYLERALALRERPALHDDPIFVGTLNNLGLVNLNRERWKTAIGYYEEALARQVAAHGAGHPGEIVIGASLSYCLLGERRFADAERVARAASELGRKVLGPEHVNTQYAEFRLAMALDELGRLEEAEELHRAVLARRRATRADAPFPEITVSAHSLARVLARQGELAEAMALLGEAIERSRRELGDPRNPQILAGEAELAELQLAAGRPREAAALVDRVLADLAGQAPSHFAGEARVRSAAVLARVPARRDEAAALAERALGELDGATPESRLARRRGLVVLAELAEAKGDRDGALRPWREAEAFEKDLSPGDPERGRAAAALARLGAERR